MGLHWDSIIHLDIRLKRADTQRRHLAGASEYYIRPCKQAGSNTIDAHVYIYTRKLHIYTREEYTYFHMLLCAHIKYVCVSRETSVIQLYIHISSHSSVLRFDTQRSCRCSRSELVGPAARFCGYTYPYKRRVPTYIYSAVPGTEADRWKLCIHMALYTHTRVSRVSSRNRDFATRNRSVSIEIETAWFRAVTPFPS